MLRRASLSSPGRFISTTAATRPSRTYVSRRLGRLGGDRCGSPTRWIRTPCWSDQTSGGAVGALGEAEHRAGGRGALAGGGLPVGGAGRVAGGVDVRARLGQLRGPHADGDQEHVGLDDRAVVELERVLAVGGDQPAAEAERRRRRSRAGAGGGRPPPGPISVSNGSRRRVDQRGRDAAGAGGRGDLLADQAGADDRDVGGAWRAPRRGAARRPACAACGRARGRGARPGGRRWRSAARSYGSASPVSSWTRSSSAVARRAGPQLDVVVAVPAGGAQREVRALAGEDRLRERRAVVGRVRLGADHRDRAVVAVARSVSAQRWAARPAPIRTILMRLLP